MPKSKEQKRKEARFRLLRGKIVDCWQNRADFIEDYEEIDGIYSWMSEQGKQDILNQYDFILQQQRKEFSTLPDYLKESAFEGYDAMEYFCQETFKQIK